MIDFKSRAIYCKLGWDSEKGKKTTYFGKEWGKLDKSEANAIAYKTGNGLVIVDVDTKDLSEIHIGLAKQLRKLERTVSTKRGNHWYFKHANSEEFVNDSAYTELVDVRSDGGLIFAQYKGTSEHISYKRVGKIHDKIPKKLLKILRELRTIKTSRKQTRERWSQAPKGEIHSATLSYAGKDFHSGLSLDEVMIRGIEYVENFLGGTPREMKLMSARIKDAYDYWIQNRIEDAPTVTDVVDVGGDFGNDEIQGMLLKAQKGGALELEKTMKQLKSKTKLSMAVMREMLAEAQSGTEGISGFFKGEVVWDSDLGLYIEVREKSVVYYKKQNFTQTVMSNSGWMTPSDVNERLSSIKSKRVLYRPNKAERDIVDMYGDHAINVHKRVDFGDRGGTKIPKLVNKLLDNVFHSDMKAKEHFIHWLAYILQTGQRSGVAWGFFGASGTGKGLLVDLIVKMLGNDNCSMNVGDSSLQSSFNSYLHNKQLVHLNEIASDFHGRHGVASKIKAMVTDPYLMLNMKGITEVVIENHCNIILNSNKPNPIELDMGDRRWNMIITNLVLSQQDWFEVGVTGDKILSKYKEFGNYLIDFEYDVKMATRIMDESVAKSNVISQTTNPLELIGNCIKRCDADAILEELQLSSEDLELSEKDIRWSCETREWSTSLLRSIYGFVTCKEDKTIANQHISRYFVKPYITPKNSIVKNSKRYYTL